MIPCLPIESIYRQIPNTHCLLCSRNLLRDHKGKYCENCSDLYIRNKRLNEKEQKTL